MKKIRKEFFPKFWTRRKQWRLFLLALFGVISSVFFGLLWFQSVTYDVDGYLEGIENRREAVLLKEWSVVLLKCEQEDCTKVFSGQFVLPSDSLKRAVNKYGANRAVAKYVLDEDEIGTVESFPGTVFYIPRPTANMTVLSSPMQKAHYGSGIDASFALDSKVFSERPTITVAFYFEGVDSFGPTNFPMLLAPLDNIAEIVHSTSKFLVTSDLSRQIDVGLPALLSGISLVLDHRPALGSLIFFAAIKGVRTLLYSTYQEGGGLVLESLIFLFNLLYIPALFLFVLVILGHRIKSSDLIFVIGGSLLLQIGLKSFLVDSLYEDDLYVDLIGSLIGFGIVLNSLLRFKDRNPSLEQPSNANKPEKLRLRTVELILLGTFASSIFANLTDLIHISIGFQKDFTGWFHPLLTPGLAIATFLDVGSMLGEIKRHEEEAKKAEIQKKDIEIAKRLQETTLPPRKGGSGSFMYRSFSYPSSILSGDWHYVDIFEYQGNEYCVVTVVDVTGHGIPSALFVLGVFQAYKNWFETNFKGSLVVGAFEPSVLVEELVAMIRLAFDHLEDSMGCTMVAAIIDRNASSMTYLSAGHPYIFVVPKVSGRFDYAGNQHSRIMGIKGKSGRIEKEVELDDSKAIGQEIEKKWKASTYSLPEDSYRLVFTTDGFILKGQSLLKAMGEFKRSIRTRERDLVVLLLERIKAAKSVFRKDPAEEDDITMVVLKYKKK